MPNTMPGNVAKGRFLSKLDDLLNKPMTPAELLTLRDELAAYTDGEPDNLLISKTEDPLPAPPNCIIDKWVRPEYSQNNSKQQKRWQRDRRHVYRHWMPEAPWKGKLGSDPEPNEKVRFDGWFEEQQPVEGVLRAGLIQVLDLMAKDPGLTVDMYWLCAGTHLEVATLQSTKQLTVLLLTPSPPITRRGRNFKPGLEDIFISKHFERNPGEDDIPTPVPDVVTVQLHRPR